MKSSKYSREFLISEIHRYTREFGIIPSSRNLERKDEIGDYPYATSFKQSFGSWNNALKAAGFVYFHPRIRTQDSIKRSFKKSLLAYVKNNKKIPEIEDFTESEGITLNAIMKYYSSYEEFVTDCGFYYDVFETMANEDLIDKLYEYHQMYDKIPTAKGINEDFKFPSYKLYVNRFGSWINALIIAGFVTENSVA